MRSPPTPALHVCSRPPLCPQAEYLDRLSKRYGREFQAMAKDKQLNFNQYTATRLQKRLDRLARYRSEQAAAAASGAGHAEEEDESDSEDEA